MWRISSSLLLLTVLNSGSATQEFENWLSTHNKEYDSPGEKDQRLKTWLENDRRIQQHNAQVPEPSFTLGHNAFSDMTEEEFAKHFNLGKYGQVQAEKNSVENFETNSQTAAERRRLFEQNAPLEIPDYVNWVEAGAVTPIKNQGACGACWAFSTTGALEGARFLKTGELVSLSEQNLLDCDHTDMGCNGGLMDNAFKFDEKSGGLCSEEDYPYTAKQAKECNSNCTDVEGSIVKTFVDVPPGDEKALLSAIAMQPISIAIQADQFVFQFYKSGVLSDDSCGSRGNIDHGVLAVGYGSDVDSNKPYFLVKNSWGETWGDAGYVKLGRHSKNEFGMCAILKLASYPIVE